MMILDEIAAKTRIRVEAEKKVLSAGKLRELAAAASPSHVHSFGAALSTPGISFICEVKKASPSKGLIAPGPEGFPYLKIAKEYEDAGAAAISVLTEPDYFLGSSACLKEIASTVNVPVLRKDFIIDEYQIYEAKVLGASAVLLICALLDAPALASFLALAVSLSLDVLTEVHNEAELELALTAAPVPRIIGINNRDLKNFTVDIAVTERLRPLIPPGRIVVSESGVHTRDDVKRLADCGVNALLVGESFMKAPDKKAFLKELDGDSHHHPSGGGR